MHDDIVWQGSGEERQEPTCGPQNPATRAIQEIYEFGPFRFEPAERKLLRGNATVALTPKALDTLYVLVRNSGHLLEKEELIRMLWPDTFVEEGSLSNNIFMLRKALGEDASYIETVPRRGYRFVGTVRQMPNVAPVRSESPSGDQPRLASRDGSNLLKPGLIVLGCAVLLLSVGLAVWRSQPQIPVVVNAFRITNDQQAKSLVHLTVTDGVRLFFVEGAPWTSGSKIVQVSAAGGETTRIATTLPEVLGIFAISPDHSELMVGNGTEGRQDPVTGVTRGGAQLWVQPLLTGTPHRVGNIYAFAACWTPDGEHILYADGQAIMIAKTDGTEPRELAKVPGVVRGLRFSPDGHRIRFYIVSDPQHDLSSLWEIDATGKDAHLLLPDWRESPYQCCGNWSADGRYYYFQAGHGSDQAIWVLPERGYSFGQARPRPFRLISGPLRFTSPVPVNDGKRLLVMGQEPRVELLRYDFTNRRFDSYLQGISAGSFDFSPDRKWITYSSYPDMNLWRSRADGSEKMQLTFPPVRAYGPKWSPDGSRIAFMDVAYYHPWRVNFVPSSGGRLQTIPSAAPGEVQADPTWTPDSESIVFARSRRDDSDRMEIYRLDLKSGKATLIPDSDGLFSPRVSPDGRYIAALTCNVTELMVFDTHTNRWSSLLKENFLEDNFWSQDGRYVYVRESSDGVPKLGRVRITDRVLEPVLSLKDLPQVVDIFTAWIGLTPDNAPVVIRDRSVQEVYALDLR